MHLYLQLLFVQLGLVMIGHLHFRMPSAVGSASGHICVRIYICAASPVGTVGRLVLFVLGLGLFGRYLSSELSCSS